MPRRSARPPAPVVASGKRGDTLTQWIEHCLTVAQSKATFYSGCRKIIRPMRLRFTSLDQSIELSSAGYTKSKLTMLTKHYLHEESRRVAVQLWAKRREQEKYGSVGFTTYNHFKKGDVKGATPRGSVFGPCIQSVVITWIDRETYSLDVYWRTTELFKKFAPDLILLRDVLLAPFNLRRMKLGELNCHFANVTAHPMYFVTLLPHLDDPVAAIRGIEDKYFHDWIVKWTARYLVPKFFHGIEKFAQALRVKKDAEERLDRSQLKALRKYLIAKHPGYRSNRNAEYADDEE